MLGIASAFSQTLTWKFNEKAPLSVAADTTGNGHSGTITGNVTPVAGIDGGAFGGFTSTDSRVFYDTGINNPFNGSGTMTMWLKNPGDATRNVIAGIGHNGANANRALELWVSAGNAESERTLNLSYGNWNGQTEVFSSSSFQWDQNVWYHLSFVWERVSGQQYNYYVYLTPSDASDLGDAIISGTVGTSSGPGPANGSIFYVGGHTAGFYDSFKPGGYFGGSIDDVSLWLGTALDKSALNENFHSIPEPATVSLLAGAGALAIVGIARRLRRRSNG